MAPSALDRPARADLAPGRPSFDRIARPYRLLEYLTFGRALERTRLAHLHALRHAQNAFVLGDGDGRFLASLLRSNPQLHATAVDSSPAMLRLLQQRCSLGTAGSRLVTLCAGALEATAALPAAPRFDLVCTHFFLDCLDDQELVALTRNLTPRLAPGALWVISDFRIPPQRGPFRWFARLLVRALYLGFRLLTGLRVQQLPDHAAALSAAGLRRFSQRLLLRGLLAAELWQVPHPSTPDVPQHRASELRYPEETVADRRDQAPIEIAYDIDLLTPLGPTPNTVPAELEREILDRPASTPKPPTTDADGYNE